MRVLKSFDEAVSGDLGFYCGRGGISDVITHLTYSKELEKLGYKTPSHTFMVYDNDTVIEAVGKTRFSSSYFYKKEFEYGRVILVRPTYDELMCEASGCLVSFGANFNNYPYGWLQLIGFLPVLFFRKIFKKDIPNPFPFFTVCSEDTLIYLRILHDYFYIKSKSENNIYTKATNLLKWTKRLNKNTTDPALLLLYCLLDGKVNRDIKRSIEK